MPPAARRIRQRLRYPHKIAADLALWLAATPFANLLRFDGCVPVDFRFGMWLFLGLAAVVKLAALLVFRMNMSS